MDLNPTIAVHHRDIHASETLGRIEGPAVHPGHESPAADTFRGKLEA
jgi:hypothetical protein